MQGQSFLLNVRQPPGLKFDELIPASSIKPRELSHRMTREGVGVPYVAWWEVECQAADAGALHERGRVSHACHRHTAFRARLHHEGYAHPA